MLIAKTNVTNFYQWDNLPQIYITILNTVKFTMSMPMNIVGDEMQLYNYIVAGVNAPTF